MRSSLARRRRRRSAAHAGDADARSLRLIDEIELLAGIDELVLGPRDLELRQRAAVEGALERVIDDDEGAGHAHLELGRSPRRRPGSPSSARCGWARS